MGNIVKIAVLSVVTLLLFSCYKNVVVEGEVSIDSFVEAEQEKLLVTTSLDGSYAKTVGESTIKVLPGSKVEFMEDSYSLKLGSLITYSAKQRELGDITVSSFLKKEWGGCSFLRIKVPAAFSSLTGEAQIVYHLKDSGLEELTVPVRYLFRENDADYYGFPVPYSVSLETVSTTLIVEFFTSGKSLLVIKDRSDITPKEFERQPVIFSGGKSKEIINVDKSKLAKEGKEKVAICKENSSSPFLLNGFDYPLSGKIYVTSSFGLSREWKLNENNSYRKEVHHGLDYRAAVGTPVFAAADGVVRYAKRSEHFGNQILIDHGFSVITGYAHLDSISVQPGESVLKGQLIGKSGNTGTTSGPHLHWGMRVNNQPVSPESLLGIEQAF